MKMTWTEFAGRFCETQEQTPDGLAEVLRSQKVRFEPGGFFLAEVQLIGSSRLGSVVILPYGPRNTFKTIPDFPFSPRGLASDTSVAIGYIESGDVPQEGA